jgi:ketosteroid isomerase-like protein
MAITVATLQDILDAFNRHDLDAIMDYFSEDCTFDFPRGPEPFGQRFVGKAHGAKVLPVVSNAFPMCTTATTATFGGCATEKSRAKNSFWKIVEQE